MMAARSHPGDLSRDELLAEVAALRQRVAALEQDKHDLEIILETATDSGDDLSETLEQERGDLKVMLDITADHGDDLSETLEQERNNLEVQLEKTTEHADAIEADLQRRAQTLEQHNQFIRDTFARYVSDDVVAQLLDSPEGLELGGEKRQVSILMSDLRGFTAVAERLAPQDVMTFLNRYLDAMVNVILSYHGTIIEILGDGLLVIFGAPIQQADDAERAVACAVAMQLQMEGVNVLLRQECLPEIEMGIGLHMGDVVVGNIGSQQRTKYGVVGSAVNLTGRIESYTTGNQILISPAMYQAMGSLLTVTDQLTVEPKGVTGPITIYDLGGIGGEHQLFLPEHNERLTPLVQAIPIRYTVLEGKFAGQVVYEGSIVKLGRQEAELHTDQPVAFLNNLKLQLLEPHGDVVPGVLFAKVLDTRTASTTGVVVRFTSMSQEVRTALDALRRYEYRVINRSIQT